MDWYEVTLWIVGAVVFSAPFAIWHFGLVGLRFGFAGLAVLGIATLWELANGGSEGFAMLTAALGAFSYVGVFALIAHGAGQLQYHEEVQ